MKLTIPRERLLDALSLVSGAVGRDGVASAVLVGDGRITASNLETRIGVDVADLGEGAVLLPHRRLTEIARSAPKECEVEITPKDNSCRITAGRGSWTIPTEAPSAFPAAAAAEEKAFATLSAGTLRDMLVRVQAATDPESSRYALGGVLLEIDEDSLHAVATDGRRLLWATTGDVEAAESSSLIVPAAGVAVLIQVLAPAASVRITRTAAEVVATTDAGVTASIRLLEGRFPRWRDAVVKPAAEATILQSSLVAAVRQAAIVTSEHSKSVLFTIGEDLTLAAQSAEAGEALVRCDLESAGAAAKVRLDPRFVLDAVKTAGPDEVVSLQAKDSATACVLRWDNVVAVVMPMEGD